MHLIPHVPTVSNLLGAEGVRNMLVVSNMKYCQRRALLPLLVVLTHCEAVLASRIWGFLGKRALSPDNTCGNVGAGNNNGYICNLALPQGGQCCSANGYCGSTDDYCGVGCQPAFGNCTISGSTNMDLYVCGPPNNGASCADNQCCSSHGYCGNTTDYCGTGCQVAYGRCGSVESSNQAAASTIKIPTGSSAVSSAKATFQSNNASSSNSNALQSVSPNGGCGPTNGGYQCASGQCCSPEGWCGTSEDYCADPDCQYQYGVCDSDQTPAGPSTANEPRPFLGSVTYTQDIIDCIQPNVVALSFDDGPYLYTSALLDVLQQFNFTATFFITGNNMGKGPIDTTAPYPSVIRRMVAEGHQVASHTWSHYSLQNISSAMRLEQMTKNERALANIIGKYPTYMRPPYSQCDEASGCWADLRKLGYHRVYFDLDTQDYLNPLPSQIQNSKNIVENYILGAGSVGSSDWLSIQHDIVQQSVTNLSTYYYNLIKTKGWKGVTVGECLNDPPKNWYRTPGASSSTSRPASTNVHSSSTIPHSTTTGLSLKTSVNELNKTTSGLTSTSVSPQSTNTTLTGSTSTSISTSSAPLQSIGNLTASSLSSGSANMTSGLTLTPMSQTQASGNTSSYGNATSTSTTCSLTTGLSPEGQLSGISMYGGSAFLSNTTESGGSTSIATAEQSNLTTNSTGTAVTPSNGGIPIGSSLAISASGSTSSGPVIPTDAGFGYAYIGCFGDDQGYRAVSGSGYKTGLTVESCAEYCYNNSAPTFAIEYYSECFCGQTLNSTLGQSTGCNFTCSYNSSEICGGFYAAQVYSVQRPTGLNASDANSSGGAGSGSSLQPPMATEVGASTSFNASLVSTGNSSTTPLESTANSSMSVEHSISTTLMPPSYPWASSPSSTNSSNVVAPTSLWTNTTAQSTNATAPTYRLAGFTANFTVSRTNTTALATNTTTSTKPSPSSQCLVAMESFCGTIQPFDDIDSCWDSVTNCTEQNMACYGISSGSAERATCGNYTLTCISLFWFCCSCALTCLSQNFLSSS